MKPFQQEEIKLSESQDDAYNCFRSAEDVAEERGLIVVYPKPNEIQIDIDSEEQFVEFERRLAFFDEFFWGKDLTYDKKVTESASGYPKRHITMAFKDREFNHYERMVYQAALNDDPKRTFLGLARIFSGKSTNPPTTLFERSEETSCKVSEVSKSKDPDDIF